MAGVNKAIIVGNLGADPEVRYLEGGGCVANINVATSRSYNNRSGEKVTETEWHRVVFWGKLAEIVEKYLKKGNSVYVEGRLQTRKWSDKDGNDRYTTEIVAQEMNMLGGKSDGGDYSAPEAKSPGSAPQQKQTAAEGGNDEGYADDLPF